MKSFLLLLLLAWAGRPARAQTYYLDLSYQLLTLSDNTLAVEKVVDGRAGQPPIGIVYPGLGLYGKSSAVAFRQGLETELTSFLQKQLPLQSASSHTIVLCVRSLHIGETMGGNKQQATADLSADVYEHRPTGYHFVRSVGGYASAYGRATGRHAGHLAQILSGCFRQLGPADWAGAARQPARTLAELAVDRPVALAVGGKRGPAILREVPRRGFYFRLDQFLTNRPDTASALVVDTIRRRYYQSRTAAAQWRQVARVRPLLANGVHAGKVPADLWGFSDGHQAFVLYEKQFYPLMRQGNAFTFVGEAPVDQIHALAQAQRQVHAGTMAGAIGGVIAANMSEGIPDHTAEPMACGLDLRTGALGPYPGLHTTLRPDTAYVYVYQMPQSQPAGAGRAGGVVVIAEGRQAGMLAPGQYLEIPCPRFGKPLHLCFTGLPTASPCLLLVPNVSQLNYLRLDATNPRQPWQWVAAAQGAADLDELDKRLKAGR